jgi:hypothetical protein
LSLPAASDVFTDSDSEACYDDNTDGDYDEDGSIPHDPPPTWSSKPHSSIPIPTTTQAGEDRVMSAPMKKVHFRTLSLSTPVFNQFVVRELGGRLESRVH